MERQILIQRADELKSLINETEKHKCFHIDAFASGILNNEIIVCPANKYADTLWHFEKVLAWAKLNDFSAFMTVTPENQPSFRLVHSDYSTQE